MHKRKELRKFLETKEDVKKYKPTLDGLSHYMLLEIIVFVDIDIVKTVNRLSYLNKYLYTIL